MKKLLLLLLIIGLVASFFIAGGHQYLTLDQLSDQTETFRQLQQQSPILLAIGFFVAYTAATALSLPGATILTLAGGAIFGFWQGLLLVSFASSVGATFAFLVSRYLLQDSIQKRFGERLVAINRGIEQEGAFYLFTLRLVPLFPFFVINLVMGLTRLKVRTFYWVSQLGMLAGTAVYVNAGTQLAQLDGLSGILSPALLLSFALLGIFPLLANKLLAFIKSRAVYRGWNRPKSFDRNLIVIGAGAGGLVSSYIAAAVKANVTLVEKHKMGGDCLNYGCVPSKALIHAAKTAYTIDKAAAVGVSCQPPKVDIKAVFARIHEVIAQIEPHDSVERYTDLGVDVRQGEARLIDPWTVEITAQDGSTQQLTAPKIILATGAAPIIPDIPGLEQAPMVTSDTLWQYCSELEQVPSRMVILGGGPIGCELSQSFKRLGAQVVQIEMQEQLMGREDSDTADYVHSILTREGVDVRLNSQAVACHQTDGVHQLTIKTAQGEQLDIPFDLLVCAVGRRPRMTGYGLEALGIDTQQRLPINEFLQTKFPNIYAVGDLAGPYQFTHVAAHQAWYAAVNSLFGRLKMFKADYRVIPAATFTDPEVARVGLNEREATEQGVDYQVTRYGIDDLDRAITESSTASPAEGFIKILTATGSDRILGATIVGKHAGELLAEYVLAMKYNLGLNKILGTIHTYPTWSESNKYVAGEWKRANAPARVLLWLERYFNWQVGK